MFKKKKPVETDMSEQKRSKQAKKALRKAKYGRDSENASTTAAVTSTFTGTFQ